MQIDEKAFSEAYSVFIYESSIFKKGNPLDIALRRAIQTYLQAADTGREEGLAAELDILVDQVLNATDLDRLKETTRMNFPDKKPQSKEQSNN